MTSEYLARTMIRNLSHRASASLIRPALPLVSAISSCRHQHTQKASTNNSATSNIIQFSDIHQYLNGMTHIPTSIDTAIHPVVPLNNEAQQYLLETNATYSHVADLKYRLHRFVQDTANNNMLSVDIMVNHEIEHNVGSEHGRYDVCVVNGSERIAFECEPILYRNKLVNPNILDTVVITDMFTGKSRQLLATDIPTSEALQLLNTIGVNAKFVDFVDQHAFDIYRSENNQ